VEELEDKPTMRGPATYRVRVRGRLDRRWIARYADFAVENVDGETVLTGPVADQVALSGLLNALTELHLPIVSVECVSTSQEEE
jgi:hypothetical protein